MGGRGTSPGAMTSGGYVREAPRCQKAMHPASALRPRGGGLCVLAPPLSPDPDSPGAGAGPTLHPHVRGPVCSKLPFTAAPGGPGWLSLSQGQTEFCPQPLLVESGVRQPLSELAQPVTHRVALGGPPPSASFPAPVKWVSNTHSKRCGKAGMRSCCHSCRSSVGVLPLSSG